MNLTSIFMKYEIHFPVQKRSLRISIWNFHRYLKNHFPVSAWHKHCLSHYEKLFRRNIQVNVCVLQGYLLSLPRIQNILDLTTNLYIKQLLLFEKKLNRYYRKNKKIDASVSIMFSFVFSSSLVSSKIMVGPLVFHHWFNYFWKRFRYTVYMLLHLCLPV